MARISTDAPVVRAQEHLGPPPGQCWCCGSTYDSDRMVHLGNQPAMALCCPYARWAAERPGKIDDGDKTGSYEHAGHVRGP